MIRHPGIVFFGTPEFAVESLKALRESGYRIDGVVTAPDKPAGRGMMLKFSAVKEYSLSHDLPLFQPERLSDPAFLDTLAKINPDIQVVVAFRMMPRAVWALPRLGTFNLHASLLPQYRGAAPINWAVINGEKETGLTTFFLREKVDTGDIILRESIPVGDNETAGELHDRMKILGAGLVLRTVECLERGSVQTCSQVDFLKPEESLKPAPKIFPETCRIDWNKPSQEIYNLIRGLSPHPSAFTILRINDNSIHNMKILRAGIETPRSSVPPGSIITDRHSYLKIPATDGDICIYELQLSGRKAMKTVDFLNGFGRSIV
jgi:methionyl-tRNA formyltransferase